MLLDIRERRLRRLFVALDRRGLAVPAHAAVGELDVDYPLLVARAPGDDERLGELERRDAGGDLHGVGGYTAVSLRP